MFVSERASEEHTVLACGQRMVNDGEGREEIQRGGWTSNRTSNYVQVGGSDYVIPVNEIVMLAVLL